MRVVADKIGLFGGTFNPVHLGHLRLAEDVREKFGLDRIVFIPTNLPPHKPFSDDITSSHRVRMIELAIAGNKNFICDDVEIRRGGVSYTIDTVLYVYENYTFKGRPFFILGSDLVGDIQTWKSFSRLVELLRFVVLMRDDIRINKIREIFMNVAVNGSEVAIDFFSERKMDITSSDIRNRVKTKRSIRYLVAEKVYGYIYENNLYGNTIKEDE